jgi:signal recognition particle subunit SRP54
MLDTLSARLGQTFKKLRGYGKISESNIKDGMREIRMALLEADVHYKVAKNFISDVQERAIGLEVLKSITPGQQIVKIVHEELIKLMGDEASTLTFAKQSPTIFLLIGLQGSGKTTTAGKLGRYLKKQGKKSMLVAADVYRPAAVKQLEVVAQNAGLPCYADPNSKNPIAICRAALEQGQNDETDCMIIDTAGRLHIDQELIQELVKIKAALTPQEILFVADSMTGQEAVNISKSFHDALGIDGVILTKLDGDARGGAALSIKAVIDKPIKFAGIGEKLDALEVFHPDRMASRILGMGDVVSLVEKAQDAFSEESALALEKKIRENTFTLEDFRDQLRQVKKMGPLDQLLEMMPGMKGQMKKLKGLQASEKDLTRIEAIINSMTPKERYNHKIINGSRRKRIARGSGTSIQEVNQLLKQFTQMRKMMKKFQRPGKRMQLPKMPF